MYNKPILTGKFIESITLIRLPFPIASIVVVKSPDPSIDKIADSLKGRARKADAR